MVQPIDPAVGNFVLRNLTANQFDLGRTLERLSSGLRVNRAADDPSGIPRIENLKSALLSNHQARLNNQASALMGATAEAGARQILNQLQRMREIALESLNDTTNDSDRSLLQSEFSKLTQEIDRVARSTELNGRKLLDGSTAAGSSARQASASLLSNRTLTDAALGLNSTYFDSNVSVDGNATGDVRFQFRLFNASSSSTTGLEISSSNQGVLATYADWTAVPLSLTLPLNGASGPSLYLNRMAFSLPPSAPNPLTAAELNTPLQTLVSTGRIDAVTYGNLALTAGGQVFSNVLNVTGTSTLNEVLTAINGLSNAQGTFNASFDSLTSKITVSYTGTGQASRVSNQTYTPVVPGAAGGPFSAFALITPPAQGPAYWDPGTFLPATGFGVASAQTYFPSLPAAVDASLSFTGSDASLLGLFGLTGQSGRGLVTGYTTLYTGETVATGNPSEYVNRTRLSIDTVTATQAYTSNDSGLTAADLDKTFRVLSGTVLDAASFSTGDFSIDFGDNGVFTYNSLNPASNSLQDIVNAINSYGATVGNRVSASFDAGTDLLTISNTAQALATNSKVSDPGLSSGAFSIDFGSNGTFNYNLNLGSTTINDLVTALNAFNPNVAASFDASTDTFSLSNQVSPAYDTKVTDPGLAAGMLSINFGDNGTFTTAFNNTTTIQGLVDAINTYGAGQGNRVSASYDPSTDKLSLTNTANPVYATKVTAAGVGAGTFTIDFGENNTFSYNFNPATDTIQSVVNAIDAVNNVTASYDSSTDKITIVNTASSGTAVTGTKVTAPGLTSGTFSIDFGSNGIFTTAFDPNSTSINSLVSAINNYSTSSAGGRIVASYNDSSDQLTITNTGAPGYDSKINNPGLTVGGTLTANYGSNGSRSVTLTNSTTIQDVVNALAAPGVTVSYNETSDTLNFSNVASGPSTTSDTKVTNPPLQAGNFSIDFGNGRIYSYAFDPNTTTIQSFQNDLNAWGASRGIAAGYDSNTDQFTITNTPQAITDTKINDAPFGVASNFTIDFGSNGVLDLTGIDGRNESIQSYVNRINAYGATQGGRVSASFDTSTDRLTISNTPLNGSTPTYDTKIDGSPLGTGTFSIDFGTNGTLNFGTVNGGSYSINSFLDAINNYTGEQAGGSVSAVYDAANDRIVISNTSVDQPGASLGTKISDNVTFRSGGTLQIDFGANGIFSLANPQNYTLDGLAAAIGSHPGVNASYDYNSDTFSISNITTDVVTTSSSLSATQGARLYLVGDLNGPTFVTGTPSGSNYLDLGLLQGQSVNDIVNTINSQGSNVVFNNSNGSFNAVIQASFSADRLHVSATFNGGSVPADVSLSFQDYGGGGIPFNSLFNLPPISTGPISPPLYLPGDVLATLDSTSGAGIGSNTSTALGTLFSTTTVTPQDNSIDFLGAYSQEVANVLNLSSSNGNTNFAAGSGDDTHTISSAGQIDNGNPGDPLDLNGGDAGTSIAGLMTTQVVTASTPGNNQIHITDFGTGLQSVLKLGNANSTGTGTQTYSGSDIDKGAINAALNLDDAGDLNKTLSTLGTEQIVTGSTPVPGNNQIKYFDIGSGFHTFFQLPVPGPDNTGTGTAQSVSSGGDVDKSYLSGALDIGPGDLNTPLSVLASTPVTIGYGSNQISINDGGTGLAAFFRLASQGNTGSGAIQATVSSGDIDKSTSTGYSVLDIDSTDFTSTSLASLVGTQIVTSSTSAGNNAISFTDTSGLKSLFQLSDVGSNVGGASGSYTQTTGSSASIDKGAQGALLDVTATDVSSTPIVSLVQANVQTSTGSNAITFNDGGTGLTSFFKLANGSGSVSSSADIDNGSTSALLNVDNAGADAGKTLRDLATTLILIGGTPGGNNQITFGGTSNLQNFFKLASVASNGIGGANTAVSSADIDNGSSNGLLDIGAGDVGATSINSLLTSNIQIGGGDNRISFGGGTGLENFFQISSLASTGSGSQTTTSAADIDKSAAHAILDVTGNGAGTDYTNTSIFSLAQTPVLYSGGNNDSITFSAGLGQQLRNFFKLADQSNNASASVSGTYSRTTTSAAAIDNGTTGSPYDIVSADVSGLSFQNLITPFAPGLPNNQILFTGALGAELRDIFNLSDVASDGSTNPRLSVSSSPIDNGALDASLELNAGQVSGSTLGQLLTPRLSTLISGPLVIDGGTVITIDPDTTTLNQVISAINSYAGPSHKTYAASFSNGRLVFGVSDTETLTPTGGNPAANPGEATPRLNGNDLIFDSAAYIAQDAPKTVAGVPLNPTGTGPAEQAFSSSVLDGRYAILNPAAPGNLSNLVFGGSSNLASVLHLTNAANANVSGPTVTATEYQGVISTLGPNTYQLQATTRQTFTATSASTSSQSLGNPYTNRLNDNQTGVIAELEITGQTLAQQDHALGFQFGRNEGNSESFGFANLTAENLRLEGLTLTGANSLQTRLRGNHVLNVLDQAIETTLSQISRLGVFESSAERQDEALARDTETLTSSLSNYQDADIASEISHLTHQQVVLQAGVAALAEQENNAQALYAILFGQNTVRQNTSNRLLQGLNGSLLDGFR